MHRENFMNMSLGAPSSSPCDPAEQTAITQAVNANVPVVVASGNFSSNVLGDPADCNGVIFVGASVLDDTTNPNSPVEKVAGYSSYANSTWGLVAPGGDPDAAQMNCGTAPSVTFCSISSTTIRPQLVAPTVIHPIIPGFIR